jgi:hypothetical protein
MEHISSVHYIHSHCTQLWRINWISDKYGAIKYQSSVLSHLVSNWGIHIFPSSYRMLQMWGYRLYKTDMLYIAWGEWVKQSTSSIVTGLCAETRTHSSPNTKGCLPLYPDIRLSVLSAIVTELQTFQLLARERYRPRPLLSVAWGWEGLWLYPLHRFDSYLTSLNVSAFQLKIKRETCTNICPWFWRPMHKLYVNLFEH